MIQLIMNPFFLNNFRKYQRNKTKILSRKHNSIIKDDELWRSKSWNNKYTTTQNQICSKNKTGRTSRITKKNFQDEELANELFLTIRETNKIRNAFLNNMSSFIKLSKAQISKMVMLGR